MKHVLHLNVNQHLILTPQLQQAIRLLQLSTLDLQQEIQNQVESNPMLEATPTNEQDEQLIDNNVDLIDEFTDFQWSNLYSTQTKNKDFNEDKFSNENLYCSVINLQEYLRWQLDLTPMSNIDQGIALAIIDAISEDGFLTCSINDLFDSLNSKNYPIDIAEIQAVRHRIQHFDPVGCGSFNLAEILLIQLEQLPVETPLLALTKKIIQENILLLGKHHYTQLMKLYHIDASTLDTVLHNIMHLNPKPGSIINISKPKQIIPDLFVRKVNGRWQVSLNTTNLPHLSINRYYASLIPQTRNDADYLFLRNNLQEARWFLKSIQSRHETLLKVANYIVNYQREFLEYGALAMKPLILNDVASALNMHESTISRVTTQKYIYTPRGLFELKYFFSSHIATSIGGECSSTAIKALIKKLITMEDHKKPLSDCKITKLINEQGITVARRTVAKYREEMGIASSSIRKMINVKN